MQNTETSDFLAKLIKEGLQRKEDTQDIRQYRYIIYARKSSESEEKQVRSLSDQVLECQDKAKELGLNVSKYLIQEAESAKEPDIRPKFRAMIEDIKKGKFDGIIAWHPDRLARNMKDAGEIIDLLDKKIIKDLKFVSFSFDNSTAGKMLLGITFVLSKQYSDQLGDNVKRGNRRSIEEGKYLGNKACHGYIKDRNQLLRPDGENFSLIKRAFEMRLDNTNVKTLDEIANFLNENNYSKQEKDGTYKQFMMKKKHVSDFLRNPIYAGVNVYGETVVNLADIYDFVPMISQQQFMSINDSSGFNLGGKRKNFKLSHVKYKPGTKRAALMSGMIVCGKCNKKMSSGITVKKNKYGKKTNYYYYRCETHDCPMKNKSVRAKVIMDFVFDFISKHQFTSKKIYHHFLKEMQEMQKQNNADFNKRLRILTANRDKLEKKQQAAKDFLINEEDLEIKRIYKKELKDTTRDISSLNRKIQEITKLKNENSEVLFSYEKFLELFENLAQRLRKVKKMDELDFLLRKLFSNFIIKDKKIAYYKLKPPFEEVVEKQNILTGGDEGTLLELYKAICNNIIEIGILRESMVNFVSSELSISLSLIKL